MKRQGFFKRIVSSIISEQLPQVLFETPTASGQMVTADSALQISAVYACVSIIARDIASLPLILYEYITKGKQRATYLPLYWLLKHTPNGWQTSFDFWEMMMTHLLLRGNCYAYKSLGINEELLELIPINPDNITVKQNADYSLSYEYIANNRRMILAQNEVMHIRAFTTNGYKGRSIISDQKDLLGNSLAYQKYSGRVFKNGATPSLVIKNPNPMKKEGKEALRESWNMAFQGVDNVGKTAILDEGMSIEKISMTPEDIQWIESAKLSRSQICGIFGMPPHKIGDLDRATFSNIEQQSIDYVTGCLRSWMVRIEQAISRDLILNARRFFVKFNADSLLRGDIKSRYEAYQIGKRNGWLSANDILDMEDRNPIQNGDEYTVSRDMTTMEALLKEGAEDNE